MHKKKMKKVSQVISVFHHTVFLLNLDLKNKWMIQKILQNQKQDLSRNRV